ncbi:MAG TPA: sodium:solute symporter family protein [Limnobacter sp.]|nr:sodium:solute symporter family protein [Limnobacter sp.]
MDLTQLTYLWVGASFLLYLGVALWARATSAGEFYVAGGGVHPAANGMATAAEWMSAASFLSVAGLVASQGYGGSVFLMGWTGGFVLLAVMVAPYLRRFGKFTLPDFIGTRYQSPTARVVAVVCLLVASLVYVIGQMTGVGVAFSRFLGVQPETGIYIGMAVVFAYAALGGLRGITYTQIAQYMVLVFAFTVPAVLVSLKLTGHALPQVGLGSSLLGSDRPLLDVLDQVMVDLGFNAYTAPQPGSMLNTFLFTASLMLGTAGLPHVIVRFFTVPTVRDARATAAWALLFIAIPFSTVPAVGAMVRYQLHASVNTGVSVVAGPEMDLFDAQGHLPHDQKTTWMKEWEETGLLKFSDRNSDGLIQYYNDQSSDPEFLARVEVAGWKGNEMQVNPDMLVLANPEIARLPNWVVALVVAGGLAAALSTAAGLLLAISTAVSHDLLKGVLNSRASERSQLRAGRWAMAFALLIAGMLAVNPPGPAAMTVALAFSLAAATLFPPIVMGIFSRRVNSTGAVWGMFTGLILTLFYMFAHKGLFFIPGATFTGLLGGPQGFLGISPEAFGVVGAAANCAVAWGVSNLTAPPPFHIQNSVRGLRRPPGGGLE